MSSNAKIDANDKPVWLAYNETTGLLETPYVDPITGALYVHGVAESGNTPTAIDRAKIDANDKPSQIAYNEDTEEIEALRCTDAGALLITII